MLATWFILGLTLTHTALYLFIYIYISAYTPYVFTSGSTPINVHPWLSWAQGMHHSHDGAGWHHGCCLGVGVFKLGHPRLACQICGEIWWRPCDLVVFDGILFLIDFKISTVVTFWPNSVSTLRGSYGRCKGRCLIRVLQLVGGALPVNFRIKWLLCNAQVHFDCAGSHKVWVPVLGSVLLLNIIIIIIHCPPIPPHCLGSLAGIVRSNIIYNLFMAGWTSIYGLQWLLRSRWITSNWVEMMAGTWSLTIWGAGNVALGHWISLESDGPSCEVERQKNQSATIELHKKSWVWRP